MLHVASACTPRCMLLRVVGSCCAKFESSQIFSYYTCKRTQQLPTILGVVGQQKLRPFARGLNCLDSEPAHILQAVHSCVLYHSSSSSSSSSLSSSSRNMLKTVNAKKLQIEPYCISSRPPCCPTWQMSPNNKKAAMLLSQTSPVVDTLSFVTINSHSYCLLKTLYRGFN